MQQREVMTAQNESPLEQTALQDGRQAYQTPTFRQLASSQTQVGAAATPDAGTLS